MKKSLIGQIVFVAILLSLWVGSTTAVTVINDCNFNANITGVYYVLGKNLTCNGSEHGINIGASNSTIDGYNETDDKHYWIDGGSAAGCDPFTTYWSGIYDEGGYDHVTIRNLEILHFCNGIFLRDTALNENYTIENCKVHDIGTGPGTQGINLKMLNHGTVKSCEIYNVDGTGSGCESGGDGIFLYDGRNNTFTCNNIHHNRKGGIFIKMMPKYTNISRNHLWKNGQAGAGETGGIILRCMLCNYNLIAFNNASNNYGDGIFIGGLYNTIEYNLVINNSDNGIDIGRNDGGDCNELYSNTVCNNGGKDIRTCGGTDPSSGCYGNTGNENTCDTTENYADEGATGCTYACFAPSVFDTGEGNYPSIFGTHNGTIILDRDITVNKMYTYPCKGTGGHIEYVRIWNSTLNVSASWDGYKGDWHNISFNDTFTLNENEPYYYEVRTGSYPQIIHAKEYEAEGGKITCTEFTDTNGKTYTNWIPAIRLFYDGG